MKNLIMLIAENLTQAETCVYNLRRQNFHAGLRGINVLSGQLMQIVGRMVEQAEALQEWGYDADMGYVTSVVSGITDAQEKQDYVLIADLLELQLRPMLLQLQEVLVANAADLSQENRLEDNIKGLSAADKKLAEEIKAYKGKGICVAEPTSSGFLTMAVTDDTGTYYFHSNVNPVTEGKIFAEQYYSLEHSHYVVFGLGLGYHIKALLDLDDGLYIDIIEPDMEIIRTAFTVMDMEWLYGNSRIRLIWDKDYKNWHKILGEGKSLVIHYPSLRHIQNAETKLSVEKFFIHDSGVRNMQIQFENNFRDNIVNCTRYVDELKAAFQDKKAVIVAAGPSLDKNVELLKDRSGDTIIVAVGTVFRKLMNLGIRPDYVIFLDAQDHLYQLQLKGLEHMDIPIICASTACKKIAAAYHGEKYLICQRGYDRAEDYVRKRGYQLYETGGSVSTIALDLCIRLGCRAIAYIGLDLAFTNNHSHAADTSAYEEVSEEDKLRTPAVGGGTIPTSRVFMIYNKWIADRIKKEDVKVPVYDATEGGALIPGLSVICLSEFL